MKLDLQEVRRALAAATCAQCGRRIVAIVTSGYRRPAVTDVPTDTLCACDRVAAGVQ